MLIELDRLRVLHQHMAGLADTGQQLVDRLGCVHHGLFRPRTVFTHGVVGAVKRMERRVRQPSFIKMDVFNIAIEQAFDCLGIVQNAVVGGLR